MKQSQFKEIKSLLYDESGITIADHKIQMVQNRIVKRLSELNLETAEQYLQFLKSDGNDNEIVNLVNALTTNVTYFFRENHHFEHLINSIQKLIGQGVKRFRIWSAGCAIGAEPYSAALMIYERFLSKGISLDIKILATDIDTKALAYAREGFYSDKEIKGLSKLQLKQGFSKEKTGYRIKPHIRNLVCFNHLNLNVQQWPMKGPFDFIFCRNLLIYFDRDKQHEYVSKLAHYLANGGYLYLGHSEHAASENMNFRNFGQTIYQRP